MLLKPLGLLIMAACGTSSSVPVKTEYVIGAWGPGEWDTNYRKWEPIFETYLTENVGRLFDPPISFKLVAVDQSNETSNQEMIRAGKIDFLCELLDLLHTSTDTKVIEAYRFVLQTMLQALLHALRRNSGNHS